MIDLHTHSTFSDGSLTPEELVAEAERSGVTAVALTDHDTTGGLRRFLDAAGRSRVRGVPGVEISADFNPGTLHMLGYFVDPAYAPMEESLRWIREGRELRNAEILRKLQKLGMDITWEEVKSYAGEDVVGRPHFAQALQARGYVKSKDEAFDRFLGKGKPAYADRRRFAPMDCIRLIREAGGLAVLAHPFTLGLKAEETRELMRDLRDAGLEGVEVYYSEHSPDMMKLYLAMARELGLVATGGSDFHGAMAPHIALGRGLGNLAVPESVLTDLDARRQARA
jgi:predicted metal-dependent phosphoesterase TrpH